VLFTESAKTPICGKKDELCAKRARRAMEIKLYDEDLNPINLTEVWVLLEIVYFSSETEKSRDCSHEFSCIYFTDRAATAGQAASRSIIE